MSADVDLDRSPPLIIDEYERLYLRTGNSVHLLRAIAICNASGWDQPSWALMRLTEAVEQAVETANKTGNRLSIDAALGLKLKRGQSPRERSAVAEAVEWHALDTMRIVLECFDLSIPAAAEKIYYSLDDEFISFIAGAVTFSADSDATLAEIVCAEPATRQVREKFATGRWSCITFGDRLGYAVDRLEDRFTRFSSERWSAPRRRSDRAKRRNSGWSGWTLDEPDKLFAQGLLLSLRMPWVAQLTPRPSFLAYLRRLGVKRAFGASDATHR